MYCWFSTEESKIQGRQKKCLQYMDVYFDRMCKASELDSQLVSGQSFADMLTW